MVKVIAWYDNEWGYSQRVVDLADIVANKWKWEPNKFSLVIKLLCMYHAIVILYAYYYYHYNTCCFIFLLNLYWETEPSIFSAFSLCNKILTLKSECWWSYWASAWRRRWIIIACLSIFLSHTTRSTFSQSTNQCENKIVGKWQHSYALLCLNFYYLNLLIFYLSIFIRTKHYLNMQTYISCTIFLHFF